MTKKQNIYLDKQSFYEYRTRVLQALFLEYGTLLEEELTIAERQYIKDAWNKNIPCDLCTADIGQGKVY